MVEGPTATCPSAATSLLALLMGLSGGVRPSPVNRQSGLLSRRTDSYAFTSHTLSHWLTGWSELKADPESVLEV